MSKAPRAAAAKRDWGSDESQTSIMHVDMDAFFAACELARRPELWGLPVVVGGEDRGVVLAATYEARAFGVRSAMPMAWARQACPQLIVVHPDYKLYQEVSHSVIAMMREITPTVEVVSIDEAFLDVSGARRRLGPPTVIGSALRARVRQTHGVTCSVGIAKNKFLAKLASTQAKPDGLLLVPAAASVPFLRTLPVGALWGVGEKTEARLAQWGITQVAQLADLELSVLQTIIGKAAGAHLHRLAWGQDDRAVTASPHVEQSIGKEVTFDVDQFDRDVVTRCVLGLCDKVAGRLRRHGLVAGTVALKVRTSDFRTLSRSKALSAPTDTAHDLYATAAALLAGVDLGGLPVRLVGVRAENLQKRAGLAEQTTLDEAVSPSQIRAAELALDAVRRRFGEQAISLGGSG